MDIPRRVANLIKKYDTRNPFELADHLKIRVLLRQMDTDIQGFFIRRRRRKFIVINSALPRHIQRQTCAHELGHARLHKGWGYYFIVNLTYFLPGRFEREANDFAWHLLFDEDECRYECGGQVNRYVCENGLAEIYETNIKNI